MSLREAGKEDKRSTLIGENRTYAMAGPRGQESYRLGAFLPSQVISSGVDGNQSDTDARARKTQKGCTSKQVSAGIKPCLGITLTLKGFVMGSLRTSVLDWSKVTRAAWPHLVLCWRKHGPKGSKLDKTGEQGKAFWSVPYEPGFKPSPITGLKSEAASWRETIRLHFVGVMGNQTSRVQRIVTWPITALVALLFGCASPITSEIRYVEGTAPCPALTRELVDYVFMRSLEFFGDSDFVKPIYIADMADYADYNNRSAIYLKCDTPRKMCEALSHATGHQESAERYGEWDVAHERFKVFWDSWQAWPCVPSIAAERGIEL